MSEDRLGETDAGAGLVGAERVLQVLVELAARPDGTTLDELSRAVASPKPTVHRALASLRKLGLARRLTRGSYVLGDEFLRLARLHGDRGTDVHRVEPALAELAETFGEVASYDVMDGRDVVVRAKADPPTDGAVRLDTAVGTRFPAYRTSTGKLLLAHRLPDIDAVREWIGPAGLVRTTHTTLSDAWSLSSDLDTIRACGYSTSDQESELGVNSLAVPVVFGPGTPPAGAISVIALAYRTPMAELVAAVPRIRRIIDSHLG